MMKKKTTDDGGGPSGFTSPFRLSHRIRGWVILGLIFLVPIWFAAAYWVFREIGPAQKKPVSGLIPVTGSTPIDQAGLPLDLAPGGVTLEARMMAEGFWETASDEELSQPGLANAAFRPTLIALEHGHFGAQGQVCVLNTGSEPTQDLVWVVQVEASPTGSEYTKLEEVYQSDTADTPLAPGQGDCYPFRIEYKPVPGAHYRAVASVLVTNLEGWLPGSENCPLDQPCPYGLQVGAEYMLPTGPTGTYVGIPTPEPSWTPTDIMQFYFGTVRTATPAPPPFRDRATQVLPSVTPSRTPTQTIAPVISPTLPFFVQLTPTSIFPILPTATIEFPTVTPVLPSITLPPPTPTWTAVPPTQTPWTWPTRRPPTRTPAPTRTASPTISVPTATLTAPPSPTNTPTLPVSTALPDPPTATPIPPSPTMLPTIPPPTSPPPTQPPPTQPPPTSPPTTQPPPTQPPPTSPPPTQPPPTQPPPTQPPPTSPPPTQPPPTQPPPTSPPPTQPPPTSPPPTNPPPPTAPPDPPVPEPTNPPDPTEVIPTDIRVLLS